MKMTVQQCTTDYTFKTTNFLEACVDLGLNDHSFSVAMGRSDKNIRHFYYYAIATAFLQGPQQYSFYSALSIMIMNGSNLSRDINLASSNSTVTQHLITTHV